MRRRETSDCGSHLAGQVAPGEYVGQWVARRSGAAPAAGQLPPPLQPARRLSDEEFVRFLEVRVCRGARFGWCQST